MSGMAWSGIITVIGALILAFGIWATLAGWWNDLHILFNIVGSIVLGVGLMVLLMGVFMSISCRNTATAMGFPHRWSFSTECLVRFHGHWFPLDQVRQFLGKP